ncbi:carboxylesterase type B [Amycolatopsis jiangsuensis]|uniref:Carboxylesterase type B n=1 Tax=Amycolatopsis jiangsuensis TaxID=1181879 RepID=A0A840ILW3_9PSEU|nr:carboxylesterase type B [Amycolatopsis jiangsuensis]
MIPRLPVEAVSSGGGRREVPLLIGATTDEMRTFRRYAISSHIETAADSQAALHESLGLLEIDPAVLETFSRNRPKATAQDLYCAVATEHAFRVPAHALAEAHAARGGAAWLYEFAWCFPVGDLGASHSGEAPFLFETYAAWQPSIGDSPPAGLAETLQRDWTSFAATGDPGWTSVDTARPNSVKLFDGETNPILPALRQDELEVVRTPVPYRAG